MRETGGNGIERAVDTWVRRVGWAVRFMAVAILLVPTVVHAATCEAIAASVAKIDPSKAQVLRPTATGPSYARLYGGCDATDRFAGRALPAYHGIPVRCSTDRNAVAYVRRFPDGTVVFESKLGVDADGSPIATGPSRSRTDQAATSLRYRDGTSVNAEDIPFVVVPIAVPGGAVSFQRDAGVHLGDLAVVIAGRRCSMGIVADTGPWFRLGEASLRVHEDLGNGQCASAGQHPCRRLRRGGNGAGIAAHVTTIIFHGSRPGTIEPTTIRGIAARAASDRLSVFLAHYSR